MDTNFKEIIDNVILEWTKNKPEELIKIINFKSIKTMIKFELTLEHTSYLMSHTVNTLTASMVPAVLSEVELASARYDLRCFLQEVRKNKLNILCQKELQDMHVSNLHLEDAKNSFRSLLNSLSNESRDVLAEEKTTAEQIDALDLSRWRPSRSQLSLVSSQTLLSRVTEYARLYETHCQQLAEEKRQNDVLAHETHLVELGKAEADPAKIKVLIESIQQSVDSRFNFFVTRSSLDTLSRVNTAVTQPGFKAKNEKLSNEMIKVLNGRIGELRKAVYSAPSGSYISSSSPILAREASGVSSVTSTVDKAPSFNR